MQATPPGLPAEHDVRADYESLKQAAHWYAALYIDGADDAQHDAWARWLAERPEHRRAWAHVEAVSRRFEPLREDGTRAAAAAAVQVSAQRTGRRRILGCLVALSGAGGAGWLTWHHTILADQWAAWRSDYRTGVGERREVVLADHTCVWLNTDSACDIDYGRTQRLITLARGEILVESRPDDRGRPLFVDTRSGRMQALGTRFTVMQTDQATLLSVFEGQVRIRNRAGRVEIVETGQRRHFSADEISVAERADPACEAWTRGVILAEDIPLGTLVAELSRYQHGYIDVDPQVSGIRVVGRFPADSPARALAMLERDLPIKVRQILPWWTQIEAR